MDDSIKRQDKDSIDSADTEAVKVEQVQYDEDSDKFSIDEQERIVRMVKQDIEADSQSMEDWLADREKDIQAYNGERPSILENLEKEEWMSDRNLGITAATCDSYQATLVSTCYNIDTLHFKATEENDIDTKESLVSFSKWGLGEQEANFAPQVDDFIHNKVTQGISYFYVYWKVWYEWIDRRIPKYDGMGNFIKYDIKTEYKRFEKGVIENIPDVSDMMFPAHGTTLQEKEHLIHRVKKTAKDIIDLAEQGIFVGVDEEYEKKLKKHCFERMESRLSDEKLRQLGIRDENEVSTDDMRTVPVTIYFWYGPWTKNGKTEEYRFAIEKETNKFLSGKPLRKINRSGKRPFIGRPFIRIPGQVRGVSIPRRIADPVNAFNGVFNQKHDFQYVENCPSGWYNPDEVHKNQTYKIIPGTMNPTSDPQSIVFPNISRSLSWAESDYKALLEVIERITGAAAYFMSNTKGVSGTATRDAIINQKSETRFGLFVNRIILDICEAVTLWIQMYQDWAPPDLGTRILGDDGKKIFENFSIETIRGGYDAHITPDIISGSKTLEKEIALWSLETLQNTVWFNPQVNPKGNWNLVSNAAKKVGLPNVERLMPPEPKSQFPDSKLVQDKWMQLRQGNIPEIDPTDDIMVLFAGMNDISVTRIDELDKEYHPNLDVFMFKLNVAVQRYMQKMVNEQYANRIAMNMVRDEETQGESNE